MAWRERFLTFCGPGVLSGIAWPEWSKIRRDKSLVIDREFLPRKLSITVQALKNSVYGAREQRQFAPQANSVAIRPPVFVLGHWRSGTTLLHNLLAQDQRFAFPNSFETSFPHTFLTRQDCWDTRALSWFIPRTRPMDDMEMSLATPQEDEFALCSSTLMSPCMALVFPRQRERFEKYLTMQNVSDAELERWKAALLLFMRKLQWRYGRPLVLKSPPHTARVRLLLSLFPQAKFVHIHRDPYRVFASSRRTFEIIFKWHGLQRPDPADLDDWVLRQYAEMYDTFLAQIQSIPEGQFHEVRFETLERDPVGEMAKLYQGLNLPGFSECEPRLRQYVGTLQGYKKTALPEITLATKDRVAHEWKRFFNEWGYDRSV